ncbi:MAG: glycoside hydrolase family 19 protein [Patescibacteria group bacterium]|nr:glycoside hydrolase family 19 protein [Patescibacteria group bacterium]
MITLDNLKTAMPLSLHAAVYVDPLNAAAKEFSIEKPEDLAAWLGNIAVESAQLNAVLENMNYDAHALLEVFPSHFKSLQQANQYAHDAQKIGNFVYANQEGNGPPESGDGFKYRGHGLPQLTFKNAFIECEKALGIPVVEHPELLLQPVNAARCAGWFWHWKGCAPYAEKGDIDEVCLKWAGSHEGLAKRKGFFNKFLKEFS